VSLLVAETKGDTSLEELRFVFLHKNSFSPGCHGWGKKKKKKTGLETEWKFINEGWVLSRVLQNASVYLPVRVHELQML
jgi:hypothetical protein